MPAPSETRNYPFPDLGPVPKPSVTCNILKREPDNREYIPIFSDGMAIMKASNKVIGIYIAAGVTFFVATEIQIINEFTTPLTIITAVSGATVALMSVGFYLKDKIDHIQNFRQNHRKSRSITS
jgi:uncharacterized protein related to proFAR isomerase